MDANAPKTMQFVWLSTRLWVAAQRGLVGKVNQLLPAVLKLSDAPASLDKALEICVRNDHARVMQALLIGTHKPSLTELLCAAAHFGSAGAARVLLHVKACVNTAGYRRGEPTESTSSQIRTRR